jgi:hypothetical protein
MSEQTINAGQVEILIHPGRQSQYPFRLIFTQSEESADDERREYQWDWVEGQFTMHFDL